MVIVKENRDGNHRFMEQVNPLELPVAVHALVLWGLYQQKHAPCTWAAALRRALSHSMARPS